MTLDELDISNDGLYYWQTNRTFSSLIEKHQPKVVHVMTWGLSEHQDFSWMVGRDVKILVGWFNRKETLSRFLERLRLPEKPFRQVRSHAKLWIFDHHVYLGSSNLSSETLLNFMIKVSGRKQKAKLREIFISAWHTRQVDPGTLII